MNTEPLFKLALEASWQASAAIVIILVARPFLGARVPAIWRSFLWTLVLVRLLVPSFVLPRSATSMQSLSEQTVKRAAVVFRVTDANEVSDGNKKSNIGAPAPAGTDPLLKKRNNIRWDMWKAAGLVWLSGAGFLGLWFVGGAIRLHRRLATDGSAVDERTAYIWNICCDRLSLRRRPRLLSTDVVSSPALVGVFRPVVLLPRNMCDSLSQEDCEHIFLHELAHFQRRDHWTHLAHLVALCFHWFNPLVWIGFRRLRADRELAADEWALQHLSPDRSAAYGSTLLRLLVSHPAPAFPRAAIGILEDGALIKQRIRRIAAFRGSRMPGGLAGLALVAGMAAVLLTAAESKIEPIGNWTVLNLTIPKDGKIADAYVNLRSPAGRFVTLTQGVLSQEGLAIEKIEWAGSPVHASITLNQGPEKLERTAAAPFVSKSDELPIKGFQIQISSKFIEISDASAKRIMDAGKKLYPEKFPATAPDTANTPLTCIAVLNEQELLALTSLPGAKQPFEDIANEALASLPSHLKVTTKSQNRAIIEVIREFRYPTAFEPPTPEHNYVTPVAFDFQNLGVSLEVDPALLEDGSIQLEAMPLVVELLGYVDPQTKKAIHKVMRDPSKPITERSFSGLLNIKWNDPPILPAFIVRKAKVTRVMQDGDTLLFMGGRESESIEPFKNPSPGMQLLVFVEARLIRADGTEVKAASETNAQPFPSASLADASEPAPFATPADGKPGFVVSPHAPDAGYVDVRGYPSKTEVKCPFSGKIFLVP